MNKVILIGNLARDPELRTTQSGVPRCLFTLAVHRRFTNAQGEREADFINCVAWRTTAEFVQRYFTKGRKCAVVGQLQTRSYEGQDGQKRYVTEVVVDEVEFVDRPHQEGAVGSYMPPQSSAAPQSRGMMNPVQPDAFSPVDDDELPF